VLTLELNRRAFLSINLDLELLYNRIISEKKKLHSTRPEAEQFLIQFPHKLLRKAAQILNTNPEITAYRFIRGEISLEISKDPQTGNVSVQLHS
jgi:hypothetical protein